MNYTKSNSHTEHAGTGQRMHDAAKAIPTQVSDSDLNMIIWSLMEVIKDAGLPGIDFSAENPDSYKQLLKALQKQRDHTHPDATQTQPGFMSVADKQRLDGLDLSSYAPLRRPLFTKLDSDLHGGAIRLQAADNQGLGDLSIGYYGLNNHVFISAPRKSGGGYHAIYIDLSRVGLDQWTELLPPAGSILITAANFPPAGYLTANGAAVSRTAYAKLFANIGTSFGAGNGSTTFNLPDLRGEFIRGWDNGRGADPGRVFGSWQDSQNRWHQHSGTTYASGEHSHAVSIPSKPSGGGSGPIAMVDGASGITGYQTYNTTASGSHAHNFDTGNQGGNEARPRNVALLMCIKY